MNAILSSRLSRAIAAALVFASLFPLVARAQDEPASLPEDSESVRPVWTETDTRLANHYLKLLGREPDYGNVLDLLWNLYEKKEQTPLLLDYIGKAAVDGPATTRTIHAHLLRKAGETDAARDAYQGVLDEIPDDERALRALAEIADLQKRHSKALSYYTRLAEVVPPAVEEGVAFRLRKAELHGELGQRDEAVATWNELIRAQPGDAALRARIVASLLEAGETGTAREILEDLAGAGEPRQRIESIQALTRLHEFTGEFDEAISTARSGLALLHFENHEYASLFAHLVRIHEQFERLSELEEELLAAAAGENPSQKALLDLAEFYHLTADPVSEENAVVRLVEAIPSSTEYRIRLVRVQMRNDRYEAAAASWEEALAGAADVPLHLLLLRAEIALGAENRVEAREILEEWIAAHQPGQDEVREILEFARQNYLDGVVERLLREGAAIAATDGVSAPVELARFLHQRGKEAQAIETLQQFVDSAGPGGVERARRLQQVSVAYRELGEYEAAIGAIEEAIGLDPENGSYLASRADCLIDAGRPEEAIEQLEAIWPTGGTFGDRADTDQKIFSLMRGHYGGGSDDPSDDSLLRDGNIQSLAQYRRLAAAASRASRPGDEPAPPELLARYESIRQTANETPSTEVRYRAAWWGFKLQDYQETYSQLMKAKEESGQPVLEVEQLLLDLAVLNERPTLMAEHLATLAEIDPANADDYLQRRAEVQFELGFEDEAVRELVRLASKPDASLDTLGTLADVYRRQGRTNDQVEVWRRAYREANVLEKRRIVKQLSTALIENGDAQGALEVQLELVERENDEIQRRKQLDTQLTTARSHFLLDWVRERYEELSQRNPFDRFYAEALARVHHAAGENQEAFDAMKKAYYLSGHDDSLLGELGALADATGDLKTAIYYRRQLLAREEGGSIENWEAFLEMLEKDLRVAEAAQLRNRLESRFGRDPAFLAKLAETYLADGRRDDAERALRKLVNLRSWDLAARFRLGLLLRERGKTEEAFEFFAGIVEDTADVEYPESMLDGLPLIETASLAPEARDTPGRELERLVFAVEGFPFLGGDLQDSISMAFGQEHPEFGWLPEKDHLVRLRAIEEAARLVASGSAGPEGAAWIAERMAAGLPMIERIWAARYGGRKGELARLLEQRESRDDHADLLGMAWCFLLAGDRDALNSWAGHDPGRDDGRHSRSRYVAIAASMLLDADPSDPGRDERFLIDTLGSLSMDRAVARHLLDVRLESGDPALALEVGEALARGGMDDDAGFMHQVSRAAALAGFPDRQAHWIDQAVERYVSDPGADSARALHTALRERKGLGDDQQFADYLASIIARLEAEKGLPDFRRAERMLAVALAGEWEEEAARRLREVVRDGVSDLRPRSLDSDQVRYDQSQAWQRMTQLLRYYSERFPSGPRSSRVLSETFELASAVPPADESLRADYERFEIERRLLLLGTMGAAERAALVEEIDTFLRDPDTSLDLAKSLESLAYHREAIPVYRIEAATRDRDYAPLQGLFESCDYALEPGPALAVIDQINAREFPVPPGLDSSYLAEQHARFLLHARDWDRLVALARPPSAGRDARPISSSAHLPYRAALIEGYRVGGRSEALLRLLGSLREAGEVDSRQLLLGANTLADSGKWAEALDWYSAIPLDGAEPELEREAILAMAAIQEKGGEGVSADEALRLARIAKSGHPPSVALRVAESAFRAGARDEGLGLLRLLRRESSDPSLRTESAMQIIRLEREAGRDWVELKDDWESLLADLVVEKPSVGAESDPVILPRSNLAGFVEWVFAEGNLSEGLGEALVGLPCAEENRWVRDLIVAAAQGGLAKEAATFYSDLPAHRQEDMIELLPSFGKVGIEAARGIVDASSLPGERFFPGERVRQIGFFHRIGDRDRLVEVHDALVRESESDLFPRYGLESWVPSLLVRHRLPSLFAVAGEEDLAGRLFRTYHARIGEYRWNDRQFLEDFVRFLISQEEYEEAEEILVRALRKSVGMDLRLVPKLYSSWGKRDEWRSRLAGAQLSTGRTSLLAEWWSALAEGREMEHYSDSW